MLRVHSLNPYMCNTDVLLQEVDLQRTAVVKPTVTECNY